MTTGTSTAACKSWRIQLINESDAAIAGKKFTLDGKEGTLDSNGMSPIYSTACPAEGLDAFRAKGLKFSLKVLPSFDSLKAAYNTGEDIASFLATIGGEVEGTALAVGSSYNSCVTRVSQAFNYARTQELYYDRDLQGQGRAYGIPGGTVPSGELKRWKGADNKAYAVVVKQFVPYMNHYYPSPDTKRITAPDPASIDGHFGVIGFVFAYAGGGGHFTLWEKNRALYHDYFGRGTNYLWCNMEITYVRKTSSGAVDTHIFRHAPMKR